MMQRILKVRPLLWIAGIVLLALIVSLTWGHQTSYDDGGIGSAAFAVLFPFMAASQSIGINFASIVVVSILTLVIGDLVVSRILAGGTRPK